MVSIIYCKVLRDALTITCYMKLALLLLFSLLKTHSLQETRSVVQKGSLRNLIQQPLLNKLYNLLNYLICNLFTEIDAIEADHEWVASMGI